ncbi:MAG TPA: aminotransferase class III-fold pyridoxal phosphate-dependent enzyme [Armatimonadota bacterium]|nr:aminotransferase class III-fold pyridoxal phosphate-dependent enzyme [Armatimonadota bacterium]
MSVQRSYDRSIELYRRALELIPGGSQTGSKRPTAYALGAYPIYAQDAEGARVQDVDGNWYVDYVLGLGPITLGYCYPAVDEAIRAQLERGIIYGLLSPLEVEAAEAICDMVPCAEMVRFLKGGSEVTTAAARIARGYTGRELVLNCGYRGWADVWAAESRAGDGGVPACFGPSICSLPRYDLAALEDLLDTHRGEVAAVFMDPVSYSQAPPEGYLDGVRALCDEHEVLLAFDEIVTGFRMASGGAQEYFGVTPDLACFAKGVANGMPVGVVCGRREVMQAAADLIISVTYGGEALSLAAVCAALEVYRTEPVFEHIWSVGGRLMAGFDELGERYGVPLRCHGYAPMSSQTIAYDDAELSQDVWTLLLQEMAARGVLLRRGGLMFITYSHGDAEVEETLAALDESLGVIAQAVDQGTVKDLLRVTTVEESFRRFT